MTNIEWCDETWNPVTGCDKISPGCKHCYAERMAKRLAGRCGYPAAPDQFADERIPILLQTPATIRFVSCEPLLEKIDLKKYLYEEFDGGGAIRIYGDIHWVIAGCESGPKRRPAEVEWFRSLRDQCVIAKVPFFLKQMEIDGQVVKMPELDGKVWGEYPK